MQRPPKCLRKEQPASDAGEGDELIDDAVTPGPSSPADWALPHSVCVVRRLCDSRTRCTADWTVGAYAERLAGRLPGGIRASVAPAQSWRDGCAGCFLPSCLFRRRRSGGLHGGRRFRRRQRNDQADGRTSTWPDSRKCFSRDPHQSAGVFVGADRHHGFRAHSLGPSTAGISCVAFDPARQRLTIVGAGPAGLTAAIAAAQHGLKATVLERVATPTPAGGGTAVRRNAMRVIALF